MGRPLRILSWVRHYRRRPNYRQWDCFAFDDYRERARVAKTFVVRHLPLSDALDDDFFDDNLVDPPEWSQPADEEPVSKKKTKVARKSGKLVSRARSARVMVFDVDKNELVPLSDGE